ncbi:MAG: hypothetical protein KC917_01940 [Candidatus Omnitrophica bacterium]|nr:hypothetical protein [Candidatus Omnitrophota bacterium]MCA9428957.1 hypothetical protein [Candidatus Omnitrophota bacterium]MCA9443989.1 hypothetical protein [Candidatus Omnitrophota bacterium]MCB9782844.1 hypothetical protein [Candidatus Omnitrophota bacterium]
MKRVVLGLVVVLALGMAADASQAFIFGGCSNSCCACAPYEVKVSYTPIQPQPGECTYCTCLPYGCPDGAPMAGACPPGGACGIGGIGGGCGLNVCGILAMPVNLVGGVLDCACNLVGGVLGCFGGCGGGCSSCGVVQ